jgi:protein-tyrosine phosphatase
MTTVLMVCMGNICRSPMAQVVTQHLAKEAAAAQRSAVLDALEFSSAGTHAHHTGEKPDPRALAVLAKRGYALGNIRSRRITEQDFQKYDLILAMDRVNLAALKKVCPPAHATKLRLFLDFAQDAGVDSEIPDPYYGNAAGFERVLDLCEAGARGLIKSLTAHPA